MAIEPITRKEQFLAKAGGQQVGDLKPITREEMFLQKIAENGGGSGGGVQPDLSQNDPNAADYVKNRTHYEETTVVNEPLNITWDGNTEGLVKAEGAPLYKVSDFVFTDEQLKTMVQTNSAGKRVAYSEVWDLGIEEGWIVPADEVIFCDAIAVAMVDGAVGGIYGGPVTFPEKGLYFAGGDAFNHVTDLTTTEPVEQTKTVIKKLDKKFLPDDVGGGSAPIVYIIDKSGDETVYSCSVDFETARTKRFSVPVYVKIITDKYCVREAFKVYTNGDDYSVDVHYEYYILEQGYSDSFVHDADGVHIVEPK